MQFFISTWITILLTTQVCMATVMGTYVGEAEYTKSDGYSDICTLTLDLFNSAHAFVYKMIINCHGETTAQTNVYDIIDTNLFYNGIKVGVLTQSQIKAENVKLESDLYSFNIDLNDDNTISFEDRYCFNKSQVDCEQFKGILKRTN